MSRGGGRILIGFLKGAVLLFAVTCVVWVAVLWRWQATSRDMTVTDIVVWLLLLPLTLFVGVLLAGWAWRGANAREAARQAAAFSTPGTAPGAAPGSGQGGAGGAAAAGSDEAERHATVQLLGAHLLTAAGASPSELLSAAKEGKPRPALDAELRDDDGMPVLAARIASIDAAALEQEAEAQLAAVRTAKPEWAAASVPEHVWRALAALREPLAAAVDTLSPWADTLLAPADARPTGAAAPGAAPATDPVVRVLIAWPLDWNEFEQELGRVVVTAWLGEIGAGTLPGTRFAVNAQASGGEELLLQADRLLLALARAAPDRPAGPLIAAACGSTISGDSVALLEQAGELFHPQRRPKGRMPAEASAALVFAGAAWPEAADASGPVPHLHRPALLVRDKSVDAPGRVGTQVALQALGQAIAASRLDPAALLGVAGNADQHTERAAELYGAAADALPQLDAAEDVLAIGHVTGSVGGVGALLVVACAAELAKQREAPCAALAVGDAVQRLALVALPGPPAVPAAAGESAAGQAAPAQAAA